MGSDKDQAVMDEVEKTILLVDDEENIIRSIKRLLRRDGYNIITADGGQAGLEQLKEHKVGVILSDQRMPEMSGVEFLSRVKELYPDTVRMVLSGYTDLNSVTDAINHGAIYKFLTKPWEDDLLRANIKDAFEHFRLARENKRLGDELNKLNLKLEERVAQQDHQSKLELRMLQLGQEVMNCQPVGVLGIGDDRLIALANHRAYELLGVPQGSLLMANANEVLPQSLQDAYASVSDDNEEVNAKGEWGGRAFRIISKRAKGISGAQGVVVTLFPSDKNL